MSEVKSIRNIAIIAHVDHGKTTLVDQMFRQSGTFRENERIEERAMDSSDQERERGITITAKNTSIEHDGVLINIIDTPGHSDFGGEVERILNMADGALLLVDSVEGTMPQTRFVLAKALARGLKPIVVVNKVDRKDSRVSEVLDMTFDLFIDLGATDEQCNFTTVYCSALEGRASLEDEKGGTELTPLFDIIVKMVPPPVIEPEHGSRLLVTSLGYDDYMGRLVVGRLYGEGIKKGQMMKLFQENGVKNEIRITKILKQFGMKNVEVDELQAGDIATLAGVQEASVGDTVAAVEVTKPLERIYVDPPTLSMTFSVNNSPFAGTEGKFVTTRHLRERLMKEAEHNVSLQVEETGSPDSFKVSGRGELHLSVLMESMRREGYELQVSQPEVIFTTNEAGKKEEPMEEVQLEVPETSSGAVIESLNKRKGEMVNMSPVGDRMRIVFKIPTRGLLGYRSQFLTETRGEGTMNSIFLGYEAYQGDITKRQRGSIISGITGQAVGFAIFNLQSRGVFFINPGTACYEGMVLGENSREDDLVVNINKEKKLSNVRSSGTDEAIRIVPAKVMSMEACLEFLGEDELLEVTPKSLRLRKKALTESDRKKKLRGQS